MYLLGYLASQSKVYLMDKDFSVSLMYQMMFCLVFYSDSALQSKV